MKRGFTLAEMMIAIAIIGILAAAGFYYLFSARDKARIARGLRFEQQVENALGQNKVAEWNFNEGTLEDSAGGDNDGLPNAGGPILRDESTALCFRGGCADYAGTDGFITIPAADDMNPEEFTISLWFLRTTEGSFNQWIFASSGSTRNYEVELSEDGSILYHVGYDSGYHDISPSGVIEFNKWQQLVATYDSNLMRLYVDGKLVGELDNVSSNPIYIETVDGRIGHGPFEGRLDEVKFYNKAFTNDDNYL